jgi:hypothetical protein
MAAAPHLAIVEEVLIFMRVGLIVFLRQAAPRCRSLYEDRASFQPHDRWYWTIYGVHAGPGVMKLSQRRHSTAGRKSALY